MDQQQVVEASAVHQFSDLRKAFDSDYTSAYVEKDVIGKELESVVKDVYRNFLKSTSLAQKERIDSYFAQWKRVADINGPFENKEKQSSALQEIMNPSDFHASLGVEQLLQNRDDSEQTIEIFKETMISPDTMKLQLYFTGDNDIINGVVAASLKNNGDLYVVTSIFD
ncbi:uncharacterized protein LOC135687160 isoform X2 [Rhopilema esculentum]|uniref:uncharacterized protein LOC135687160 isoform X2 n=1 Tax=Rhopilema esculentum TaxID=499914 RepID=UPI0031E401D0